MTRSNLAEDRGSQAPSEAVSDAPDGAPLGLVAARLIAAGDGRARVALGGRELDATIDAALDPRVLATAAARGERIVLQREDGAWIVLGALRTTATPGVDEGDFEIRAGRLRVVASHAFEVVAGGASFVLRATGHVETLAEEITARASSVQRLVARMLRLN